MLYSHFSKNSSKTKYKNILITLDVNYTIIPFHSTLKNQWTRFEMQILDFQANI